MTTASDFLALAERCEREQPSRELDAAIATAIGWADVRLEYVSSFTQDWHGLAVGETEGVDLVPLWTRSLDAAASLVPAEGVAWWEINVEKPWPVEAGTRAAIVLDDDRLDHADALASTPALALCVAALRARAALAEGNASKTNTVVD